MYKLLFICVIIMTSTCTTAKNYTCDYKFGDGIWPYEKEFYDKNHTIPEGKKDWNVSLPYEPGYMISLVCVNIPEANKNATKVYFSAQFHTVLVRLAGAAKKALHLQIQAMRHGY